MPIHGQYFQAHNGDIYTSHTEPSNTTNVLFCTLRDIVQNVLVDGPNLQQGPHIPIFTFRSTMVGSKGSKILILNTPKLQNCMTKCQIMRQLTIFPSQRDKSRCMGGQKWGLRHIEGLGVAPRTKAPSVLPNLLNLQIYVMTFTF